MLGVELFLLHTTEAWVLPALRDAAQRDPSAVGAAVWVMAEDDTLVDDDGIDLWAAPTMLLSPGSTGDDEVKREAPVVVDEDGRFEMLPTMTAKLQVTANDALLVELALDRASTRFDDRGRLSLGATDHLDWSVTLPTTPGMTVVEVASDVLLVANVAQTTEDDAKDWLVQRDMARVVLLASMGKREGKRRIKVERALLSPLR
ncbi:MAG: hypothetical protein KC621_22370 [Myxococcales bacterium]|nr:hypothetical protein [Myxococcales bacterium]